MKMRKKNFIIILGTVIMIGGVFGVGVMVGNKNNENATPVNNNDVMVESVEDELSADNMELISTITPDSIINEDGTITEPEKEVVDTSTLKDEQLYWIELGFVENHPNLRLNFDKIMRHKSDGLGKSGTCYINLNNEWTNNSALRYAFNQPAFYSKFWDKIEVIDVLAYAILNEFADMTYDIPAGYRRLALVNAYWGIFNTPDGYFNGGDSLTRAEFLTGVYKAHNPVDNTIQGNDNLVQDKYNVFVNQMLDYSYINMFDASNYNGTMSRAEAVYTIVNMYFKDEIGKHDDAALRDAKDGGNITLDEALNGEDGSLPTDLYEALLVAKAMGIIEANTRWDEEITKVEALDMITATYSSKYVNKAEEKEFNEDNTVTENGNPSGTENNQGSQSGNQGQTGTGGQVDTGNQGGNNNQTTTEKQHVGFVDGKIDCSKELGDEALKLIEKYGLDKSNSVYLNTIVYLYYTKTESLDNSKIHKDILEDAVKEIAKQFEDAKQKEEDKQKQDDTFKNDTGQDAPEGWTGIIDDGDEEVDEGNGLGDYGMEVDPTGGEILSMHGSLLDDDTTNGFGDPYNHYYFSLDPYEDLDGDGVRNGLDRIPDDPNIE